MDEINLYIYSDIKSNSTKAGSYIYILEMQTSKGAATLSSNPVDVEGLTGYQVELAAITAALKRLTRQCRVNIYASNIVLTAALKEGWYKKWILNGYKHPNGQEISHINEWKTFIETLGNNTIGEVYKDEHTYTSWMRTECERRKENRNGNVDNAISRQQS